MTTYRVEITKSAEKAIAKMPARIASRIASVIRGLEEDPRPVGVKKLRGHLDTYRVRIGDYRVVYTVRDDVLVVTVTKAAHRRDVYEGM